MGTELNNNTKRAFTNGNTVNGLHQKISQMTLEIESYDEPPGVERQYVVKLEDLEHYVKSLAKSGGFKEQYEMLRSGPDKPCSAGKKTENKAKNRYQDLLPCWCNDDDCRVVLQRLKKDPHSDYINASYVDSYERGIRYICTQGPLENTIEDFWRMVWQEDVNVIAMTANIIENGKKKCEKYWPDKVLKTGEIVVTFVSEKVFLDYTERNFKLQKIGVSGHRTVRLYQYTAWPDHGVPAYAISLLMMLKDIKDYQKVEHKRTPWVLHCSAGVGRSGTVMVLDSAIEMSKAESKIDILGLLYKMRQQRINLIETVEQYTFVYRALVEYHFGDISCKPASEMVLYFNKLRQTDSETKKTGLDLQFEKLRSLEPEHFQRKCLSAVSLHNKHKNRDPYIIPPDHARPLLKTSSPSNYINAVYTHDYGRQNHFVVTQYPLPSTVADFWQLLWDTGTYTVVVLNEFNNKDVLCFHNLLPPYATIHFNNNCQPNCTDDFTLVDQSFLHSAPVFWPPSGSLYQGSIKIEHISSEPEYYGGVLVRQFRIKNPKGKTRTVKTFHLHGWRREEFVPPQVDTIVQLIAKVDKWTRKNKPSPVVVTCYDGCRAAGFFCASSYLAAQIHDTRQADVVQAVRTVRLNRPAFVPTVEQYRWLYELACFLVSEKILK